MFIYYEREVAVWAIAYGKHLTPVFHLDMEPFLVEYTGKTGKSTSSFNSKGKVRII